MTNIVLSFDEINDIDLGKLGVYVEFKSSHAQYLNLAPGQEHYKLIGYLTQYFSSPLIDIGTYLGCSALALSYDENKEVITYDLVDWLKNDDDQITYKDRENIEFRKKNCLYVMDTLISAEFIVLDVDPHDGLQEVEILKALEDNGYSGVVLLDDIHLNKDMETMWNNITQTKYDVTKYGHFSGTGLVIFDDSKSNVILS